MFAAPVIISFLHGLFASPCHLFSKSMFAVLADVSDAGRSVAAEDECEELSYQIVVEPTILDVRLALGAGVEALFHAALADLTP
jgi:hypothetical protein